MNQSPSRKSGWNDLAWSLRPVVCVRAFSIGALVSLGISTALAMIGPARETRAAAPIWPDALPVGWPTYPIDSTGPGAGLQREGSAGAAWASRALGRELRRTHVYELKGGRHEVYTVAEFRTGWPFRSSLARGFRLASGQVAGVPAGVWHASAGIALAPPRSPDHVIGPTIPLAYAPVALAGNVAFWGVLAWTVTVVMHRRRRLWRQRTNRCIECGFPRGGDVCPECGQLS